ncbi:histidine kinase [Streptomyces apricus]|uniref:histidine kinase n=1 Tax=Streptomyces apricus TaxID=1828112 RepID=A0A5B0BAT2_9ACTN|nr:histidine kinase dimerization/phosphoacceptor domain-containing protein [Streptomyces apricus]KAA0939358.1 histidine kinase [Streptomyces apricus]
MRGGRVPAPVLDVLLIAVSLLDVLVHEESGEPLRRGAALLATAALALRRHAPLPVFVLTLPAALVSDALFAPLAALYTLASLNRHRVLLAAGVLVLAACDLTHWTWPAPEFADLTDSSDLVTVTYSLATATAPVFLGQLVQARRELSLRLTEISRAREHERELLAQSVLAAERAQLAREMHDVVSHQVSLIAVRAGALQVATRDDAAREAATTIRQLSVQTLEELRRGGGGQAVGDGDQVGGVGQVGELRRRPRPVGEVAGGQHQHPGRQQHPVAVERGQGVEIFDGLRPAGAHPLPQPPPASP